MERPTLFKAMRAAGALLLACTLAMPAAAQMQAIDPDKAIDSDLMPAPVAARPASVPQAPMPASSPVLSTVATAAPATTAAPAAAPVDAAPAASAAPAAAPAAGGQTFRKEDLVGAAEGVFGKGARGLAEMIEDLLKKQGEPNGYIVGREGGGAFVVGVRYGAGKLFHKVEGQMPVYWTGPSFGIDAGANAGDTFVLVYNLYDSADLFRRYAAGEGQAYLVGGFHVSYLRHENVVLIPVRAGAGLRLGVNVGYMKFSRKRRYSPF